MKKLNIKIKDLEWEVVYADPIEVKFNKFNKSDVINEEDDCGVTFKQDLVIYINKSLKPQLLHRTIIHELVHAYVWTYGLEDCKWGEEQMSSFIETHCEELIAKAQEIEKELKEVKKNGKKL